jgi:hypothetical protein
VVDALQGKTLMICHAPCRCFQLCESSVLLPSTFPARSCLCRWRVQFCDAGQYPRLPHCWTHRWGLRSSYPGAPPPSSVHFAAAAASEFRDRSVAPRIVVAGRGDGGPGGATEAAPPSCNGGRDAHPTRCVRGKRPWQPTAAGQDNTILRCHSACTAGPLREPLGRLHHRQRLL